MAKGATMIGFGVLLSGAAVYSMRGYDRPFSRENPLPVRMRMVLLAAGVMAIGVGVVSILAEFV